MQSVVVGLRRGIGVMCAGVLLVGLALPASAQSLMLARPLVLAELFPNVSGYDPVEPALALGLTPESMDARFDRNLAEAERCTNDLASAQTIGCALSSATLPTS